MPKIQKMNIVLLTIGKTKEQYLIEGLLKYQKRLKHYIKFDILEISNIRNSKHLSNIDLMKKEGELILEKTQSTDYLILLDEKGKESTSSFFADKIQVWMLSGKKRLVFVVGGAYGFSEKIYNRSNEKLSLCLSGTGVFG